MRDACAKTVFEREPIVLERLTSRETERGKKAVDEIDSKAIDQARRYFDRRRKKYLNAGSTKVPRHVKDYEAMVASGIDFSGLAAGVNPFSEESLIYDFMRLGVEYVLSERIFKARDIQEYFMATGVYKKASTARSYSNRIVSILLESGQIKKEGKVYCL